MSKPRLGFLGTGWIGRHRMQAICASGHTSAVAIFDPDPGCLAEAQAVAPDAAVVASLDQMLSLGLDGIVIATPSAQHASQSIAALQAGAAVFCQKPLGRDAEEVAAVIAAARAADRLLAGDFSYRHTSAMRAVKRLIDDGALGRIFAVDLEFHNAYGPDKPWFYDRAQSGGGCVMDLGSHMVDQVLWALGFPGVERVTSQLYAGGSLLPACPDAIEDFACATLGLESGVVARMACSWRLHAGQDALIGARFYGTAAGAAIRNIAGSFYDFEAVMWRGTQSEVLVSPPDDWGGRAAVRWAEQLARGSRYRDEAEQYGLVALALDRIYRGDR